MNLYIFYTNQDGTMDIKLKPSNKEDPIELFLLDSNHSVNSPNLDRVIALFDVVEEHSIKEAKRIVAKQLWSELSDIPTSIPANTEQECIDEPFEHFPKGTLVYDIWFWFEAEFDISVGVEFTN